MPDSRFFRALGPLRLGALAEQSGARLGDGANPDALIADAAPLDAAGPQAIAYLDGGKPDALVATRAGAVFVRAADAARLPEGVAALIVSHPRAAFARAVPALFEERGFTPGAGLIDPTAVLEEGVRLSPGVVIGPDARIGAGALIGANAVIGPGVCIGRGGRIGAGVSIVCALIGDRVTILANSAIGQAGFGVAAGPAGTVDVPQLGRVILQDDVSIGALSAVDRGAFGDTTLGQGARIDNFCHIGHNCSIGRHVVMAAYAGVSGSVTIGDGVMFGGRVGIADHRTIGPGARLAAGAAVLNDVPAGETWGGYPARPARQWMRETATLSRLAARKPREGDGTP
jgi:UDP-3-O-[3-hydroxymyristoyl] glucosamine N-acyltransferase